MRFRTVQLGCLVVLLAAPTIPLGWVAELPALCPFRLLTGLPCPGCGMTRSLIALAHGDVLGSIHFHPLGPVVALGLMAIVLSGATRLQERYANRLLRGALAWIGVVVVLVIWAVRLPLFLSGRWVF